MSVVHSNKRQSDVSLNNIYLISWLLFRTGYSLTYHIFYLNDSLFHGTFHMWDCSKFSDLHLFVWRRYENFTSFSTIHHWNTGFYLVTEFVLFITRTLRHGPSPVVSFRKHFTGAGRCRFIEGAHTSQKGHYRAIAQQNTRLRCCWSGVSGV